MSEDLTPLWDVPLAVADVPETGRRVEIAADEAVRQAIAKEAGINDVKRLSARFEVTPYGKDGLRVEGLVSATVGQTCVVSLEPMESEIEEAVALEFLPPDAIAARAARAGDSDDESDEDGPDPLIDGVINLGAIAAEFLILGIDPYPRKPDAVLQPPRDDQPSANPFAALAALKPPPDKDRS